MYDSGSAMHDVSLSDPAIPVCRHPTSQVYVGSNNAPAECSRPPRTPEKIRYARTQHVIRAGGVGPAVVVRGGGGRPVRASDFWRLNLRAQRITARCEQDLRGHSRSAG